jgi:cytidyltransferase-like protein
LRIVLVTGGFDPIHSGHIAYLRDARELGDKLIVGVNSDDWLTRKKGRPFMPWEERATIVAAMHYVDRVINFNDNDGTAIDAIRKVKEIFPNHEIVFANGGDRTKDNIPEMVFDDVEFVFGIGGENKANSSSWILNEWKAPKTERPWGYYRILHNPTDHIKVKELTVNPGYRLSMQRHEHRAEFWFVAEGTATVKWDNQGRTITKEHCSEIIHKHEWHQLINNTDKPLKIIEIQYGLRCDETDIERQ